MNSLILKLKISLSLFFRNPSKDLANSISNEELLSFEMMPIYHSFHLII